MLYSADRGAPAPLVTDLTVALRSRLLRRSLCALALWALAVTGPAAHADTLENAVEQYRPYMIDEVGQALAGARTMQSRIEAKDIDGAKKAWIAARVGWERAEVFTNGFVAELDEEIDAWPNALTGFHAIEAKLFGANSIAVEDETKTLIYYLTDLDIKVRKIPLNAQGMLNGTARLAYEVGESKADGGESRYSGTSLDDMRNNVSGIQLAYKVMFAPSLEAVDPKLATTTEGTIEQLTSLLAGSDLKSIEPEKVRAASEELVVALQEAAPKIGLRTPTLEDITQ
jgi:iron uptake system component EfeO